MSSASGTDEEIESIPNRNGSGGRTRELLNVIDNLSNRSSSGSSETEATEVVKPRVTFRPKHIESDQVRIVVTPSANSAHSSPPQIDATPSNLPSSIPSTPYLQVTASSPEDGDVANNHIAPTVDEGSQTRSLKPRVQRHVSSRHVDDLKTLAAPGLPLDRYPSMALASTDGTATNLLDNVAKSSLRDRHKKTRILMRSLDPEAEEVKAIANSGIRIGSYSILSQEVRSYNLIRRAYRIKRAAIRQMDVLFCILYLVELQFLYSFPVTQEPRWLYTSRPKAVFLVGFGISCYMLVSSFFRIILADRRVAAIFSWTSFVDCLVCIPFVVLYCVPGGDIYYIPYFLRSVLVVSRLRRLLRTGTWLGFSMSAIRERVAALVASIIILIYLGMCFFNYFEYSFGTDFDHLDISSTLYYIVVTISTVGYGDINPKTIPGRENDLFETDAETQRQKAGRGSFQKSHFPHVVMVGVYDNASRVKDVLTSFYERQEAKYRIVFLSRKEPSPTTLVLLGDAEYKEKVTFLVGKALDVYDMKRAEVQSASAVFIVGDRFARDPVEEDNHNCLRLWAFDDYSSSTDLYISNLVPETENGHGNEIYTAVVHPVFVNQTFAKVSWYLFREFQIILFAVLTWVPLKRTHHILLNPGNSYILKENDKCILIAQSPHDFKDMEKLDASQFVESLTEDEISAPELPRASVTRRSGYYNNSVYTNNTTFPRFQEDKIITGQPEPPYIDAKVPICHMLRNPTSHLKDVVFEDCFDLENHFLVTTNHFNLFRFVCTLRSAQLEEDETRTIVFLCPRLPTHDEFTTLCQFPNVYFVCGDPSKKKDLLRGGLVGADKVIILYSIVGTEDDFSDSKPIMISHLIYGMFPEHERKYVIVELQKRSHIKFLRPTAKRSLTMSKRERKAHSNQGVEEGDLAGEHLYTPMFAAGRVVCAPMLDSILYQTFHNSVVLDIFKRLCGVRYKRDIELDRELNANPSYLSYIDTPDEFAGRPFRDLYRELALKHSVIPLGILRDNYDPELGNRLPFTYTNPMASLLLKSSDLVFALMPLGGGVDFEFSKTA
ncbi:hypothetical protein SmJEL517_g00575 [Synchytrium microbalum]|uniref:Uncharacterized protein n=1 Tax=Synchytrium microbalum TaxID=1806994 RepID=A0A507CHW9_9FUNG|nr:uncharacterized protein SmJEL517_g00575 [Synchytrium microbalum]TPX37664.1 hypothetical protein SmJEL517_g00575 [Synchytrium microbalum]